MSGRARGTVQLRLLNTRRVLSTLRRAESPVRIAELAAATSLTRPTVAQIVSDLEGRGWVQRHDPVGATGRPAARYALAHRALAVLAIDAGAHRAVVEVVGLDGAVRSRREQRHRRRLGPGLLELLRTMSAECLDEAGLRADAVLAATVASPGIIDQATGDIEMRHSLGGWRTGDVVDHLRPVVGGTVAVENDANLAAQAMREVVGMPDSFLGLQWGRRLGAGLVLDGRVHPGALGAAGEIGSLLVTDPPTGDLRQLEEVVQVDRLARVAGVETTTERMLADAAAGEENAVAALGRAVDPIAAAVAPICLALDLHVVTVSGAIARGGAALAEALRGRLAARGATDVACVLSPFLEDTVLRGAASHAIETGWRGLLDDVGAVPVELRAVVPDERP